MDLGCRGSIWHTKRRRGSVVGGAGGLVGAPNPTWLPARRVLRPRGVPEAAVVCGGPDRQRPLRDVPRSTLPCALRRPGALRQQQHHLHIFVPSPPGHLFPGTLHWCAPPGQLRRCGAGQGAVVDCSSQPHSVPPISLFFPPAHQAPLSLQMLSRRKRRRTSCDLRTAWAWRSRPPPFYLLPEQSLIYVPWTLPSPRTGPLLGALDLIPKGYLAGIGGRRPGSSAGRWGLCPRHSRGPHFCSLQDY